METVATQEKYKPGNKKGAVYHSWKLYENNPRFKKCGRCDCLKRTGKVSKMDRTSIFYYPAEGGVLETAPPCLPKKESERCQGSLK